MKVELQILNMAKEVVHEPILRYEATPPLPLAGEDIVIELKRWTVKVREFGVFSDGSFKVALWCEGPKEFLDEKY